jgi:DNA polymerase-3 subunit alpha (Gram-positive type)
MSVVYMRPEAAEAWLERLALADPGTGWDCFSGATVDELCYWPERSRMRVTLGLAQAAEETGPFLTLRAALRGTGMADVQLKVHYAEGALGLSEYLALHFEDLCSSLRFDLNLEPHWMGGLDYEVADDEDELHLRVGSDLALTMLRERKAAQHLGSLLAWACGAQPKVSLELGPLTDTVAIISVPAPALQDPPTAVGAGSPRPPAAPAVPAKPTPKIPEQGLVIEGRPIPADKIRAISSLVEEEGDISLEGEIFRLSAERKKTGRSLVKLALTDGTDSLGVTWWLEPGKDLPKSVELGMRARVRGPVKPNKYENEELNLELRHLVRLPPRPRRQDLAPPDAKRVELHAHTKMSAADGLTNVADYIERAAAWGHPAVGLSDHGVVHAFPEAYKIAKKKGIKLLLGMEAYLVENADFLKEIRGGKKLAKDQIPPFYHCIVYARNETGRRHLYDLVSASHVDSYYKKPLIPRALLQSKREGLIVGSACEAGELYQAILEGADAAKLEQVASFYDYLEVQRHENNLFMTRSNQGRPPVYESEEPLKDHIRTIIQLAQKLGKPCAATSDLHFLDPEDEIYRRILQSGNGFEDAELQPPIYFHTTDEMKAAFAWLNDEALIHRIVVEGPQQVAALCDSVPPVPQGAFFPEMPAATANITELGRARARELYGDPLPPLVDARLERELTAIVSNKFSVLYEIARLLVKESNDKGYMVGSRGSVGSSFLAHCLKISEVNPLPAHERCPACRWVEFRELERLSGVDLPKRPCPNCGGELIRDGHNIPFETFVGFKGDKVPDIDLNFAPEVQTGVQKYAEELFGKGQAFKAGTISTLAEKTAFGYVKKYYEAKGLAKRRVEVERVKAGLEGVKRTSGQHPGGVILVRADKNINDFTPVQFSGDLNEQGGREKASQDQLYTTHFDYHAIDECLVKLDILGKDDGSAFKHLHEMTGLAEWQAPLDDPDAISLFNSQTVLKLGKLTPELREWLGDTGAVALPEFGTANTRRMLELTRPKNFTELIYISGLSHGTGVWANNAEGLIQEKTATLETVISTRDDIMNKLIQQGMAPEKAFKLTEKVRKGGVAREGFTPDEEKQLQDAKLPKWWIDSCRKIEYMFPKAHAAAYCFTAVRMAYFKAHHPAAFYCAWLTLHAEAVESDTVAAGVPAVLERLRQIKALRNENKATAKDEGTSNALVVCLEALLRGLRFHKVDLYKSLPHRFLPLSETELLMPLVSLAGLGATAAERMVEERVLEPFMSIEDLAERCGLNKTVIEKLTASGALDILPKKNQTDLFGF